VSGFETGGLSALVPVAGLDAPDAVSLRDPYAQPGALTPSGARPIVKVLGLEKFFGSNHVLRGCTLEVYPSETVCLIGKSGSGKSTLLRCINFLEEPTMGAIEVDGIRVDADPLNPRSAAHRERIRQIRLGAQMVFQEFNLFPHLRVIDNLIEAPMRVKGLGRDEAIAIAEKFLRKVGLTDKRDEFPSRLSGGQKQRVAIARALTMEPKVLMFDEPTSALDPTLVGEVLVVMEELAHEGATMIVVTHEMAFAREAADRVYFIDAGRFVEVGPPEQVIDQPEDPRTREFLARTHGTGAHVHGRGAPVAAPAADPLAVQAAIGQPGLTALPVRGEREDA
jgi:ABC-type polar amino acid transport system ATPase subunit